MTRDRPARIALCIPTFRRPGGLERALRGVAAQRFRRVPEPEVAVHVVDNDAGGPMKELVERLARGLRGPVLHHCEPRRGIATVRNRCLDLLGPDDDALVFLDDDEVPRPDWLDALIAVAGETRAEIVQGPVLSHYVDPVPDWFVKGRFLQLGPFEDGRELRFGYSGNVLIDAAALREIGPRFDERFNATGGEDQHFFIRMMREGCRIVTAGDAVVDEWVPATRTTLASLLKRRARVGATLALAETIEDGGPRRRARRALRGAAGMAVAALALPVLAALRGRAGGAEALGRFAYGAGQIAGLTGRIHREYDVIHAVAAEAVHVPRADEERRPT